MRMPPEFSVVLIRDCIDNVDDFINCPEFSEWTLKHQDVLVG